MLNLHEQIAEITEKVLISISDICWRLSDTVLWHQCDDTLVRVIVSLVSNTYILKKQVPAALPATDSSSILVLSLASKPLQNSKPWVFCSEALVLLWTSAYLYVACLSRVS